MSTSRSPSCPSLPPELWIRILSHHHDLTHLWTTCRLISSTFCAYVEQVFAEYHIRSTRIDFQLEKFNLGGKSRRPEIPTTFHRFESSEGKRLVYFRDKRGKREVGKEFGFEKVMERWEDRVRGSKPETPHYTVMIGGVVNDTALPGLAIHAEEREVSFDWRGMFRAFFREQERMRVLKIRWHRDCTKRLEENRKKIAAGEKIAIDDLPKAWPAAEQEFRKMIRRARLKECYKDNKEMVWALASLKYYETTAGKLLTDISGAGVGEPYFNSIHLLQGLYLDEWSSLHRIDTKVEHLAQENGRNM
ncbi:hypothetical protein K469DRAFT_715253 [Zopfia rhizophila CBS 207.26]|uniref:F-box domain-containing protein n=1 Tax=Zopfia rhizophila CBS 207.26 TaxID=1314779 RepID=A0A6A6EM13_9PEZI|nr:hypothetical protein K469DRAFT_715253 [Zopfia rhizophila CBS 207.26]